jgi:alpha-tubulin suppressor-like RCC1 family protein
MPRPIEGISAGGLHVVVVRSGYSFMDIAAGSTYSMGLSSDGSIWGWGLGTDGSIGDGTTSSRSSPVMLHTNHSFSNMAAFFHRSVARRADGAVFAWGGAFNELSGSSLVPISVAKIFH